jgi:PKD repeat protein
MFQMRRPWSASIVPVAVILVAGMLTGAFPAAADSAPEPPETVPTVTADSLPTVQVDGVVWDQLIVGNTVYATGSFRYARPAGASPTTGRVRVDGALAYDLRTGDLIRSWNPRLNGPGRTLAVSSDRKRIFIGGDFTRVSGASRQRLVAVHPTSGAVISSFRVNANSRVSALAVSGNTLYIGGNFTVLKGSARKRLAAVRASSGALYRWAPRANKLVNAVIVPSGVGNVVVGGRFGKLSGRKARGMGALSASSGAVRRWDANKVLKNYGNDSAITSLSTDGSGSSARVFGTAYNFHGPSRFEGSFRASGVTGAITWINGCRGDTYDAVPVGPVLYSVGHAHGCQMLGGLPDAPTKEQRFQRALATTTERDGVNTEGTYKGKPAPRLLHWLPTLNTGTYTGQNQGPWTVEATDGFVVMGGEFTQVNRKPQQGLARFAVRTKAPNAEGPQGYDELTPTATGIASGTVRVRWQSAWDRDNRSVTHELLRGPSSATATVVATSAVDSQWWERPFAGLDDTGLSPGSSHTYRVRATDALGNTMVSAPVTATVPRGPSATTAYRDAVLSSGASAYWRLGESAGIVAHDFVGTDGLVLSSGVRRGAPGALPLDPDSSSSFPGTMDAVHAVSQQLKPAPKSVTVEAWINTRSKQGGKVVGFGNRRTGLSSAYDRHIYMDDVGRITFGVWTGTHSRVTSAAGFNDGAWHHVVGTLGPAGLTLHVDGKRVGLVAATRSSIITSPGYWRIGGDRTGRWPSGGSSPHFKGRIDDVAIYPRALTTSEIAAHAALGTNRAPVASFTATPAGLTVQVDGSASRDPNSDPLTYDWDFGDGTVVTRTGATASHTYAAAGTYTVTLTVTDTRGARASTSRSVPVTAPTPTPSPSLAATTPAPSSSLMSDTPAPSSSLMSGTPAPSPSLAAVESDGAADGANGVPVASFTATPSGLTVQVDGSASDDPDADPLTYDWDFGDGTVVARTGATASHTYAAAGTYTVTLTVTDTRGATASTTRSVTVEQV